MADHAAPPDWARDAIFYQVFPDRFAASARVPKPGLMEPWAAPPTRHGFKGGDLLGLAEHLDDLADLGITAIYLTPVFASASNHRYHTYDYFQVDPLLGGDAALRELLDEAHARAMRVVLDGVFNHTGRGFWAFHHVLENGADSPYRGWFHLDPARLAAGLPLDAYPVAGRPPRPAPTSEAGPVGGSRSLHELGYQAWWDQPPLPKLNLEDPGAREHVLSAAEHWLRFGIDGWRLDVPEEIQDPGFWPEFRRRCRAVNPEAYLVGEIWHRADDWLAGDRFDAVMNYPLAEAILSFTAARTLNRELLAFHHEYGAAVHPTDAEGFAARLVEIQAWYRPETTASQLNLLDSHDTPRFVTIASGDRSAYRLAVALQAVLPGPPCTYYGDEIGMEGGMDPDCRRSYPVDPAEHDGELRALVRAAFGARAALPALRRGGLRVVAAAGDMLAIVRGDGGPDGPNGDGPPVLAVVNAAAADGRIIVRAAEFAGRRLVPMDLPGWPTGPVAVGDDGTVSVALGARSAAILVPR